MQMQLEVSRLKPIGRNVLIKKGPVATHIGKLEVPAEYRDRNSAKGMLFEGVAIAVGDKTKAAMHGHERDWFEPGDRVWFWHMWDWHDHEVVMKDKDSGDEYLMVAEKNIHAFELGGS